MRVRILIWGLMLFSLNVSGANIWTRGVVILNDDQVLSGLTQYNDQHDLVQFKDGDKIKTFNFWQVKRFTIYDPSLECPRNFVSATTLSEENKMYGFLEVVIKGEVSMLRKKISNIMPEGDFEEYYEIKGGKVSGEYVKNALQYDYYFEFAGELYNEKRFSNQLYSNLITHFNNELLQFVDDNDLNVNDLIDQVIVIKYYNELQKKSSGKKVLTSS